MGKEYKNETRFITSAITKDGDKIELEAVNIKQCEFFYVKNLNGRMNMNDLATAMELSCRSARDIKLFFLFLNKTTYKTKINVTQVAKAYSMDRKQVTNLLKRMVEANALYKTKASEYLINPFMVVTINDNEKIEQMQNDWSILKLEMIEEDEVMKEVLKISDVYCDFPPELIKPGKKTHEFLESLLRGHAVYGKLTDKQKDIVADIIIRTRMSIVKSEYKNLLGLQHNLKHISEFTKTELSTWNALRGVKRLNYWYYEMENSNQPHIRREDGQTT